MSRDELLASRYFSSNCALPDRRAADLAAWIRRKPAELSLNPISGRSILVVMTRVALLGCVVMLAACASGPPDLPPGSGFPRNADVDPRLNLNGSDRVQIARLVAAATPDPIRMVWRAGNPNKILVTCGAVNLVHPSKPWAKGPGFMMQRTGSTWNITDRLEIDSSPGTPSVEPISTAGGFKPYGL